MHHSVLTNQIRIKYILQPLRNSPILYILTYNRFYILFFMLDLKPYTFLTQMYIPLKNMNFKKIYISIVYIRASLTRFLPMIFTDKSLTSNDNHKTTMQWHRGNSKLATYICTFLLKINILARRCRQYKWLSWQPGWIPFMNHSMSQPGGCLEYKIWNREFIFSLQLF